LLALGMSLLLSYQGTQSFLKGIDGTKNHHMIQAAALLPAGESGTQQIFEYHVASSWEQVPVSIKSIFPNPPTQPNKMLKYRKNWWYFAPPQQSYALLLSYNESGETRYVSYFRDMSELLPPSFIFQLKDPMVQVALGGASVMLAFMLLLYWTFRNFAQTAQAFFNWAKQLNLQTIKNETPNFHYHELNALKDIMHRSMQNMGKALDRENEFLGYASHELRTPIATLRTNAALLDHISPDPSSKERDIRDRIHRASLSMKGITETLLWLSRDNEAPLATNDVQIDTLLLQVIDELHYLLADKEISISIDTLPCKTKLCEAAFRIVIENMVRNAFQHTVTGFVAIKQSDSAIELINTMPAQHHASHTGFGLGLNLIRKITTRFNWTLEEERSDKVNMVRVSF